MHMARLISILCVVFLALGVGVARAGLILGAPTVSGPGCSGPICTLNSGSTNTLAPNNDDLTAPSANTILLSEHFTSINFLDARFTVFNSQGVTEYFSSNITVNNNTGFTWTNFHWSLIPTTTGDGLDFDTPNKMPTPTSSSFAFLQHLEDQINWSGGAGVANNTSTFFTLSIDVPDGLSSFTLRGVPTVNGVIPEPASLVLLGSGLAGLGLWRRRHA
jgi:hypothetical protein